ncbi:MAG: alpha/beta fold hydrolase [Myxococcota bacterium]
MTRVFVVALALLAACRAPSPLEKQPPFDFDARPGPERFSREAELLSRWNDARADSLRDFWNAGEAGSFAGVDGVEVVYRVHRAASPKADVVLMPGRTEAIIKYAEVVSDLVAQGYTTWALTLRGQGEAGRMLPDPEKGYVAFFDDYVSDAHQFLSTVVRPEGRRVFLLAHSLSGGVAANLVDEHPGDVDALVLSAPMLEIDLGAFPPPVAASLAAGVCDASDGTAWAIGSGPYREETDFAANTVSQSEARWTWKVQQLRDDERIRLGGLTWRWLCQALAGSSRGSLVGRYSSTPTLLLQAGDDRFVKPGGQNRYCGDAPRCTLSRLEGGRHELLQEKDEVRDLALSRIVKFFDAEAAR